MEARGLLRWFTVLQGVTKKMSGGIRRGEKEAVRYRYRKPVGKEHDANLGFSNCNGGGRRKI